LRESRSSKSFDANDGANSRPARAWPIELAGALLGELLDRDAGARRAAAPRIRRAERHLEVDAHRAVVVLAHLPGRGIGIEVEQHARRRVAALQRALLGDLETHVDVRSVGTHGVLRSLPLREHSVDDGRVGTRRGDLVRRDRGIGGVGDLDPNPDQRRQQRGQQNAGRARGAGQTGKADGSAAHRALILGGGRTQINAARVKGA
jgi:hypothetical protein